MQTARAMRMELGLVTAMSTQGAIFMGDIEERLTIPYRDYVLLGSPKSISVEIAPAKENDE